MKDVARFSVQLFVVCEFDSYFDITKPHLDVSLHELNRNMLICCALDVYKLQYEHIVCADVDYTTIMSKKNIMGA